MGKELGRISGPLLADNLLRNGNDLAFETSLLYLDVNNYTVSVNLAGPRTGADLYTPVQIDTTYLNVSGASTIGAFTIDSNTIQDINNASLTISPNQATDPIIVAAGIATSLLTIAQPNTITNATNGSNINITPSGTGEIFLNNNTNVNGTLRATGNITFNAGTAGTIQFGSDNTDNVVFNADINSNIIPNVNNSFNLGSAPVGSTKFVNAFPNGQYLETTVSAPGTGRLTYEWWFNQTSSSPNPQCMFSTRSNSAASDGIDVSIQDGGITITSGATVLVDPFFLGTLQFNTWYHFALTRVGSTACAFFINGVNIATFAFSTTTSTTLRIGHGQTTTNDFFNGYISNFRYVKGTAVYSTGGFTVPTVPLTAIAGTELLLTMTDSSSWLTDSSTANHTVISYNTPTWSSSSPRQFIWNTLYSQNINVTNLNTSNLTVNGINLAQQPGKTIYVSINGTDGAIGKHPHAPVRSLKYALSIAASGDEIIIFPGIYTEVFPLTVPQGVTVKGMNIRSVTIQPTAGTNTQPAFYLNGDTTVEFLTITGFYSNYAFRLAANYKATAKSPYIQNVTVTTKGSVTSGSDPKGYNQADAGGGAYIDGSVADPTGTVIPAMLFFSVTFIVPNANGLVLTNGSRSEWLNSFSYFAQRGIYLLRGTAGRFNQGTIFNTELRSINSANIYGAYGAVVDGLNTLAYLVGHNFAYIGNLADTSNDPSTVISANETVRLNSGVIYYESDDQSGNLKIGTVFSVNQATGVVSFNANTLNLGSSGTISLTGPNGSTYIDKFQVEQTNIRIAGNTISSLAGDINWLASSSNTYLNTNVAITGNLSLTGDANIKGSVIKLGNQTSDVVQITDNLTQTIYPNTTNTYDLGAAYFTSAIAFEWLKVAVGNTSTIVTNFAAILNTILPSGFALGDVNESGSITSSDANAVNGYIANGASSSGTAVDAKIKAAFAILATYSEIRASTLWAPTRWNNLYLSDNLNVNGVIQLGNNTITTLPASTDLVLSANGTGLVVFNKLVSIQNNLTVSNKSTFGGGFSSPTSITGTVTLTGNAVLGGVFTGLINKTSGVPVYNNQIYNNLTPTNYSGLGTGATFSIQQPINAFFGTAYLIAYGGTGYKPGDTLVFAGNLIGGLTPDNDLTFVIPSANIITRAFTQTGNTNITGTLVNQSNILQTNVASYLQASNIKILSNTVSTTNTNGDLNLIGNGTGSVQLSNLKFNNNAITTVNPAPTIYTLLDYADAYVDYLGGLYGRITFVTPLSTALSTVILNYPVGTKISGVVSGVGIITRTLTSTFQFVSGTYVANTLEFVAQSYSFNSTSFFNETNNITFTPNGTGNTLVNSTTFLKLPVGNDTTKQLKANGEIRFNNVSGLIESFEETGYVNWMNLWSQDRLTYITPELTPNASDDLFRFAVNNNVTTTLDATKLLNTNLIAGQVKINNNIIRNADINSDLVLSSNGFGLVRFNGGAYVDGSKFQNPSSSQFQFQQTGNGYVKFSGDSGVVLPTGSSADRNPNAQGGELRYNTDSGLTEIFDPVTLSWGPVYGSQSSVTATYVQEQVLAYTIVLGGL